MGYLQKFTKFTIKVVRNMFIYVYALRVLVIYTNWKKNNHEESQKKWSIYKYFFNEDIAIKVKF
jgi:hypothetical protein